MKNLYHRNKGKVYPSSSSSSSPINASNGDALSVLNLLPTAILALAAILSLEDREVLAYLITRSINTTNPSSMIEDKKKYKKPINTHKPHLFDCGCFDCYTNYWFRWDSSPNRELIHQVIEAFEDHLTNGERSKNSKNNNNRGGKKREKMLSRRVIEKPVEKIEEEKIEMQEEVVSDVVMPECDVFPVVASDSGEVVAENKVGSYEEGEEEELMDVNMEIVQLPADNNHKGLARKVLPDVLGILNSRLWSFWNPNI